MLQRLISSLMYDICMARVPAICDYKYTSAVRLRSAMYPVLYKVGKQLISTYANYLVILIILQIKKS